MQDFFPTMSMKPNTDCDDYHCRAQQKAYAEKLKSMPAVAEPQVEESAEPLHEENEWGISLVDEDQPDVTAESTHHLASGVHLAYERRVTMEADAELTEDNSAAEQSLEDLMSQMKQL